MPTREIPSSEWRAFFHTFSQLHEGWLATLEVTAEGAPVNRLAADALPLMSISAATEGGELGAIEITLGGHPSSEPTHIINNVERVVFQRSESGKPESIEIVSAEGGIIILQLRPAARKELPRAAGGA